MGAILGSRALGTQGNDLPNTEKEEDTKPRMVDGAFL
jgi:hypothetical protein